MDLTRDDLNSLMRRLAVPLAVGMLLQTVLNLTDQWFAGRISTLAQASLALSFPLFFVLSTFGSGLSTGAAALVGRYLGAGNREGARKMAGQATLLAIVLGCLIAILGPVINYYAFISMGAEGPYLQSCLAYMNMIFYFAPVVLLLQAANAFLTAQGNSYSMRNALIVAVFANVFLDNWFIFGGFGLPALGVMGLALATSLVHLGAAIYLWYKAIKTGLFLDNFWVSLKPDLCYQKELLRQAIPSALNMASVGVGIYIINIFVNYFGQEAVAAYGVAVRLEQVVLLPAMGISAAVLPLTAQNAGANLEERVLAIRRMAMKAGFILFLIGFPLLYFLGPFFMGLVSPNKQVVEIGALYLKMDGAILFAYTLLNINIGFLQGLKRPFFAMWMGLYRQIAAPVPVFWLLAFALNLKLFGLWLGIILVTVSGAIFSEFYVRRVKNSFKEKGL